MKQLKLTFLRTEFIQLHGIDNFLIYGFLLLVPFGIFVIYFDVGTRNLMFQN